MVEARRGDRMRVVFVHGACVKDGAWWWHLAAESLADKGVTSEAPARSSCGEARVVRRAQRSGLARHRGGAGGCRLREPPAADLELPARGRPEPLLLRRRGARPVPR